MLEQCTDAESTSSLLGTFDRYLTIWNCMDVMPTIVKALDGLHQVLKHRGAQSRPLLTLLMKFDNGRYLGEVSRSRICSDITAFTLVCFSLIILGRHNSFPFYRHCDQSSIARKLYQKFFLKYSC